VIDTKRSEVRISVPLKAFAAGAKTPLSPGVKLSELTAWADRVVSPGVPRILPGTPRLPLGSFFVPFDEAAGGSYVMGTPSCVAVGK
jgi:hypothetical protein